MKRWLTKIKNALGILTKHKDEQVGLFIPNRQVSWIFSSLLFMGFLCFILGYFWGHRRALQRFVAKIEEESFADRISYALYTMNDRDISEFEQEDANETASSEDSNGNDDQDEVLEVEEVVPTEKITVIDMPKEPANQVKEQPEKVTETVKATEPVTVFVAPLAGFGTLLAATEFSERIKLLDPKATVQKRSSKTQKGRAVTWYQVMTGEFEKREDLQEITSTIQQKEHIKKIEIIEKRKG